MTYFADIQDVTIFTTVLSYDLTIVRECSRELSVFALFIPMCNNDRLYVLRKVGSCVKLSTQMHVSIFTEPLRMTRKQAKCFNRRGRVWGEKEIYRVILTTVGFRHE